MNEMVSRLNCLTVSKHHESPSKDANLSNIYKYQPDIKFNDTLKNAYDLSEPFMTSNNVTVSKEENNLDNDMMSTINLLTELSKVDLNEKSCEGTDLKIENLCDILYSSDTPHPSSNECSGDLYYNYMSENPPSKNVSKYYEDSSYSQKSDPSNIDTLTKSFYSTTSGAAVLDFLSDHLSKSNLSISTQSWENFFSQTSPPVLMGSFFKINTNSDFNNDSSSYVENDTFVDSKSFNKFDDISTSNSYYDNPLSNQSNVNSNNNQHTECSFLDHSILKTFFQSSSMQDFDKYSLDDHFSTNCEKSPLQLSNTINTTLANTTQLYQADDIRINVPIPSKSNHSKTVTNINATTELAKETCITPLVEKLTLNTERKLDIKLNRHTSNGEGPSYWGMWEDERDRMIYVSWLPRAARAVNRHDKKQCELVLKHFISNILCFEGIIKVLLFPPSSAHCKLLFSNENSAQHFLKAYGGFEKNIGPTLWKLAVCNYFQVKMRKGIYATRVKIIWADQTKNNDQFVQQCNEITTAKKVPAFNNNNYSSY